MSDEKKIQDLLKQIQIIHNPESKHTEYNIFTEEDNDSKADYIGVSKLYCGYCHYELGIDKIIIEVLMEYLIMRESDIYAIV